MASYLEEIKARCEAASKAPWVVDWQDAKQWCDCRDLDNGEDPHDRKACPLKGPDGISSSEERNWRTNDICETDSGCYGPRRDDALFISHARTDLPIVIEALERLAKVYSETLGEVPNQQRFWAASFIEMVARERGLVQI